jgi:hypothetical protein
MSNKAIQGLVGFALIALGLWLGSPIQALIVGLLAAQLMTLWRILEKLGSKLGPGPTHVPG